MTVAELVVKTSFEGYRAYAAHEETVARRRGAVEAVFTGAGYHGLNALWAGPGWTEEDVRAALGWCPEHSALFHVGPHADAALKRLGFRRVCTVRRFLREGRP
jgi:hypothetical protein